MGSYILKRLLLMIPTLIGITFITFCIIRAAPGDPIESRMGQSTDPLAAGSGTSDQTAAIINAKVLAGLLKRGGVVRPWDLKAEKTESDFFAHDDQLYDLEYSPDGRWIATCGDDGDDPNHLRLWSVKGRLQSDLTGSSLPVSALTFSADSQRLATVGFDRVARVYDLESPEGEIAPAVELKGHERVVGGVAFSPSGALLATGSRDKSVRVFDLASAKQTASFTEHYQEVTSVVFLDETTLVSGSRDRTVLVWDLETGKRTAKLEGVGAAVYALGLSPDKSKLAAGLGSGQVALWDTEDLTAAPTILKGHTDAALSLAFHPTRPALASSSKDHTIHIWNLESGEAEHVLLGHDAPVKAVSYHPDGEHLLSGSSDISEVPFMVAYFDWMQRLLTGDLGTSLKDSRPVVDKISEALPITLLLSATTILLTYLFSIPLGVYAGARRGGLFDQSSSVGLFLLYSMPSFWVATMLIVIFGSQRGYLQEWFGFTLPYIGLHKDGAERLPYLQYLVDHGVHLILPLIALTYGSFAFLSRLMRTNMLETLNQDYIRTARAKGLNERVVIWKHAFRNSLISIVTVVGNLLPMLIGGSVIIESVFEIPGMGKLGFDAILQRDYPVLMAITTLTAVLTMVGILLSDILYSIVDPRIRQS